MIKVFVDDWREAPSNDWKLVRTITEAIRLLETGYVSTISLDYDIAFTGLSAQFSDENYGTIARYISSMPEEKRPTRVYLHTANLEGQEEMKEKLKDLTEVILIDQYGTTANYKEQINRHEENRL